MKKDTGSGLGVISLIAGIVGIPLAFIGSVFVVFINEYGILMDITFWAFKREYSILDSLFAFDSFTRFAVATCTVPTIIITLTGLVLGAISWSKRGGATGKIGLVCSSVSLLAIVLTLLFS